MANDEIMEAVFDELDEYPLLTEIVRFRIRITDKLTFKYHLNNG